MRALLRQYVIANHVDKAPIALILMGSGKAEGFGAKASCNGNGGAARLRWPQQKVLS